MFGIHPEKLRWMKMSMEQVVPDLRANLPLIYGVYMRYSQKKHPIFWIWTLILLSLLIASLACQASDRNLPVASPTVPVITEVLPSFTVGPTGTLAPTRTLTPTPTLSPTDTATATPTPTERPAVSRQQLRVFEELWTAVYDNYLYTDFLGLDWNAIYDEYRAEVEKGLTDEDFYLLMDGMIARLGDDHSIYLSPEMAAEEDSQFAGEYDYAGIGVLTAAIPERDRLVILLVFPDSPAETVGLASHDSILAVDGVPVIDEAGFRQDLLRGPVDSLVTITVQTPGQQPRDIQIQRKRITSSLPVPYQVLTSPQGARIGYILIPTFNDQSVDNQIQKALESMNREGRLDGIILDNRMNGGGADTVLSGSLAPFTSGLVGYFVNRDGKSPLRIAGRDIGGSQSTPLVVLVGDGTASFGEVFSGILQDLDRATLIGEQTDGNVEILWGFEFSDGSRAWIAHDTFRPLNHLDANWEESGIIPDISISSHWDEVTTESDPVILSALEFFDQR